MQATSYRCVYGNLRPDHLLRSDKISLAGEHEADMGLQACIRFDAIYFLQYFLEVWII